MMKNYRRVILLLFILLFIACDKKNPPLHKENKILADSAFAPKRHLLTSEVKKELDSLLSAHRFNGTVSMSVENWEQYVFEGGYCNFTKPNPITENTHFSIASISKQFTAVLLLKLSEQGEINLTDSLARYVLDTPSVYNNINLHNLLTHTSGLGLSSEPGVAPIYHYSNKGYNFLQEVLEKTTGMPYQQYLSKTVRQLGLKNTSTARDPLPEQFASAYTRSLQDTTKVPEMPQRIERIGISVAAGGIISTAKDLHNWNYHLYSGKILSTDNIAKMTTPYAYFSHYILGEVGYGYGIMIQEKPVVAYMHTGYVRGAPSLLIYYPAHKLSVAILSNIANEAEGKKAIFNTHSQTKNILDRYLVQLQTSTSDTKN